ncbi:MAG TPA: LytTR family DNA-binding domain-containing protein [Puia sp.]|nr:LytTR family DNA-binding domain-containing protein [Puia sp.]
MLYCIIIDDEPLARKGLKEYIQDVDFLHCEGEFENPLKAMDLLLRKKIDLIFLDIQMPKITGLEFMKTLSQPPQVIFTTAYPHYAVEGFELNAIDYLLKPFSFERFWKAVVKVRNQIEANRQMIAGEPKIEPGHFFIKSDSRLIKIKYEDILFVEALQNYVAIYTKDKKHIAYLTFKSVEENLPQHQFLKIHKSFIVAIAKIESIEGNEIKIGSHSLPISRTSKEEVMEKILQNRYLKR